MDLLTRDARAISVGTGAAIPQTIPNGAALDAYVCSSQGRLRAQIHLPSLPEYYFC